MITKLKTPALALLMLLYSTGAMLAQATDWLWAKSSTTCTSDDAAYSVTTDAQGNVYVVGYFFGDSIRFSTTTLQKPNGPYASSLFILKYNQTGDLVWAKSPQGSNSFTGLDGISTITTDTNGNLYIVGSYMFQLILGTDTLNANSQNIFICKCDANGNVLWAKQAGTNQGDDAAYNVTTDANGSIYVLGVYRSDSIVFGATILYNSFKSNGNNGTEDIFLAKYDTNGNVVWAKSMGGSQRDYGYGIACDLNDNIIITGYFFSTTLTIGTYSFNNPVKAGVFIAKYDNNGNVIWVKSPTGYTDNIGSDGLRSDVVTDGAGNIYLTGKFSSPTLNIGSISLANVGEEDIFLAKYDPNGNVVWAKSYGGVYEDYMGNIILDNAGNLIISGAFYSPLIHFDAYILVQGFEGTTFLTKIDTNGNTLSAIVIPGSIGEGKFIAANSNNDIYIAGGYYDNYISFGTTTLNSYGGYDMFIAKLSGSFTTVNEVFKQESLLSLLPNPASHQLTINLGGLQAQQINIYNTSGRLIAEFIQPANNTIDVAAITPGIYIAEAQVNSLLQRVRWVKM
ncbi:MAG: T9SS type A sorting domain-containing protein [Chitinophagales bacterium]|nr:T9SS type A sorting domain-containing protein [Chitinophagales bacterium]